MTREDILAVVVSFNGGTGIRPTVEALLPQVGEVCIVDNGSDAPSLEVLAELERLPGVSVVRLGQNRGVGYALNVGRARAREARSMRATQLLQVIPVTDRVVWVMPR